MRKDKHKHLLSVLLALLIVALLAGSALASESKIIEVTPGTVAAVPYSATAIASDSDSNGYYEDVVYYSLTYTSDNLIAGIDYMLMVVESGAYDSIKGYTITPEKIIYIDQAKAFSDNANVSLAFPCIYPSSMTNCHVLLGGTFNNLVSSPCKIAEISSGSITLQNIAIKTPPTKLTYFVGESLDLTGLVVTGTYSDANMQELAITEANITGFDSSAPAESQTLTITYGEQTTTYVISITEAVSGAGYGDVSGDGRINSGDATLVLRYYAQLTSLTSEQLAAADVNGDGKVNSGDATLILRYYAKLISSFPVQL